jgi:hydroxylamine reductase
MPPKESYAGNIYTTAMVGYPGLKHISETGGKKDFKPLINKALELGGWGEDKQFTGINGGTELITGFAHNTVMGVAEKLIAAVKSGGIKHFFLVGGCDGARTGRNYYTNFVKQTPMNTVVLTLACGKFRFNDLNIGEIGGLPRLLDMGQCNDAYSAIKVAVALAEAFKCDVNELPLTLVLSWYEQKAVCILLTLLSLGIKNIYLGPSLPAFISPNVLKVLVEKFNIKPISTPEVDMKAILS